MYNYYTQCIILHTVYNFTFSDHFELLGVTLRCFVARQLLSRIYALLSVKFPGLKLRLCKKNDNYQVCLGKITLGTHFRHSKVFFWPFYLFCIFLSRFKVLKDHKLKVLFCSTRCAQIKMLKKTNQFYI